MYCKYHPLEHASYSCASCEEHYCEACTNERLVAEARCCFHCNETLEYLGAGHSATPFWRRLEKIFRYPLNTQTIAMIVMVSIITSFLGHVPFSFIIYLMVLGAFLKYCFSCMEHTALGLMVAPEVSEVYDGGLDLIGKLLGIFVSIIGIILATYYFLGGALAGIVATILIVGLPAAMINFGMTDSVMTAVSPIATVRLMTTIGLAYGLLLALLMIMMVSVGLINGLIGEQYSMASNMLQSMVSNYYLVVAFHLMGYMIFQYQGKLGFAAGEMNDDVALPRSERDQLVALLEITLKEGDYDDLPGLYADALKRFPDDRELQEKAFRFLCATGNREHIDRQASMYLEYLVRNKRHDQLRSAFKMARQVNPAFIPASPIARYALAQASHEGGDFMTAVVLVNGMHKQYPDYPALVSAYELMLSSMQQLPKLAGKVDACRKLIAGLKKRQPTVPVPAPAAAAPAAAAPAAAGTGSNATPAAAEAIPETAQSEAEEPRELAPIEFQP